MSDIIQELIDLYNNRKRISMKPSPLSLFFLKEGNKIAKIVSDETGGGKPDYKTTFLRIKYEWSILYDDEKLVYIETAVKLGFKPKEAFNTQKQIFVGKKIEEMKSKMGLLSLFF